MAYTSFRLPGIDLATRLGATTSRPTTPMLKEYPHQPVRASPKKGSASNNHRCEEARRNLYRSIIDASGSMDVPMTISNETSSSTSQVVKLFVDYIVTQHQCYNGRLQFESSVKTFKHVYLYVSSVSSSPLEVFDQVFALLAPLVPRKVWQQLKCVQFTAHVRQRNLTYARSVLLSILSMRSEQKPKLDSSKYVRHRFPLDLNTVSDLMRLLLVYPSKNKQSTGSGSEGRINIGTQSNNSDSAPSSSPRSDASLLVGHGGEDVEGSTLFPILPQVATFDARRVQQRQSIVVFELYTHLVKEDLENGRHGLLRKSKTQVVDQIHEHGARAAIALNKCDDAVMALGKISKHYLATGRMQALTLHLLRMVRRSVDDDGFPRTSGALQVGRVAPTPGMYSRLANKLCLMIPLNLISYRSQLSQMSILTLGTSDTHYDTAVAICKEMLEYNPRFSLRMDVGLSMVRYLAGRGEPAHRLVFLLDLTWKSSLEVPSVLRDSVEVIVQAAQVLREARRLHDSRHQDETRGGMDSVTHSVIKADAATAFAKAAVTIPEKVQHALSAARSGKIQTGKEKSIQIINRALEVLLMAYEDSGLGEESWTTLQSIYDCTMGQWAPDSSLLTIALGGNTRNVVLSVMNQFDDKVLPSEFLVASIFDSCLNDDRAVEDGDRRVTRIESDLLLALWGELASRREPMVRHGAVLSSALRFAFSRDVKVGLAFAEVSVREALIASSSQPSFEKAKRNEVNSVLATIFETVNVLALNSLSLEATELGTREKYPDSLSLMPLAVPPMLYNQYSVLRHGGVSRAILQDELHLDRDVVALGALILLREYISYPPCRESGVKTVADHQQGSPPDLTLPFKVAYRSRKDPVWKRLVSYFESCRALDSAVLEKIGGISESWLQIVLMAHRLDPSLEVTNTAENRDAALNALDKVVSQVILRRMGELSGMTETQSAPSTLTAHLSVDVFTHAISIAATSLNDSTQFMDEEAYMAAIKRCQGYYATARDLFGVLKADRTAFALLNVAAMRKDSLIGMGFGVIRDKIKAKRRLNGREAKILTDASCRFGLQRELAEFWSEMHVEHAEALGRQSTAVRSLLEAHILTNNETGILSWTERITRVSDRANIPPATLKALLFRYSRSQCTLSCLDKLLPLLSKLSTRYFDSNEDSNSELVKSASTAPFSALLGGTPEKEQEALADYLKPRSLPLSMELLRRTGEDLLHDCRYQDALVLLDFVHPEIWPYDHLLCSLAESARDSTLQVAKKQMIASLALTFLRRREELIENGQGWCILPLSESTVDALQIFLKRGGDEAFQTDFRAVLERDKLHRLSSEMSLPSQRIIDADLGYFGMRASSIDNDKQSFSGLLQLGLNAPLEAQERNRGRAGIMNTWVDLLEAGKEFTSRFPGNMEAVEDDKDHVTKSVSMEKEEVQSGLLALLRLHQLAPSDSEAPPESDGSIERGVISTIQDDSDGKWHDPEAPESLQAFEKELENLGNVAVKSSFNSQASFQDASEESVPQAAETYLEKLLRGGVPAPARSSGVPRLRAMGSKSAWKEPLRATGNLASSRLAEQTQQAVNVDEVIMKSLLQGIKRLLAQQQERSHARIYKKKNPFLTVDHGGAGRERDGDEGGTGDVSANNNYFEVYNRAIELYDKRREDTYRYLSAMEVHAVALDLLTWCKKVGEAHLAVLITESTASFTPDKAADIIPGVYAVLDSTRYVPDHDVLVGRAFTALASHLAPSGETSADVVPLIEMSLQSCLPYRGKSKRDEMEVNTIDGSGYIAKLESDRELLPVLNSSRILGHLGLLAQHPDALCQHTVSSTLRSILFSSSTDQEALKHKPSIDLALGVLSLSLQADVYPDDRTCELMAKTLLRHGYSSISQRLFAYLRFQGFLCGLSSYKILVNYLVRHASNMEVPDFDAVIEIIDHVHTLEASQNQYTAMQGRLSRLLAEHMMLQIIREGADTDDGVVQQLKKYTNADILSA